MDGFRAVPDQPMVPADRAPVFHVGQGVRDQNRDSRSSDAKKDASQISERQKDASLGNAANPLPTTDVDHTGPVPHGQPKKTASSGHTGKASSTSQRIHTSAGHSATRTAGVTSSDKSKTHPAPIPTSVGGTSSGSKVPSQNSHGSSGPSGGVIAAAVIVPIVVISVLVLGYLWYRRRNRRRVYEEKSTSPLSSTGQDPRLNAPQDNYNQAPRPGVAAAMATNPRSNPNSATSSSRYYAIPRKQPATRVSPFDDTNRSHDPSRRRAPSPGIPIDRGHDAFMDISPEEAAAASAEHDARAGNPQGAPAAGFPLGASLDREKDDDEVSAVSDDGDNIEYGNAEVASLGHKQRASVIDTHRAANSGSSGASRSSQEQAQKGGPARDIDMSHEPPKW